MAQKAVTVQQIADRCGLSKSTVAYILREPESCSARKSTKELVFETARKMGYVVNTAARALSTGSYKTIGLLFPHTDGHYGELIIALDRELKINGFHGIFSFWENDGFPAAVKKLSSQGIDGIISLEIDPVLKNSGKPVVIYGNPWEGYDCVYPDKVEYAHRIFDYITKRGYKKIGYFGITTELRGRTLKELIIKAGLPFHDEWFIQFPGSRKYGEAAMEQLLKATELPEVIILHSDLMLGGVLKTARRHNIRIPEDIALASYDNLPESALFYPEITTVDPQTSLQAEMLLETLIKRMNDPQLPIQHIAIPTLLIERDSLPLTNNFNGGIL